MYPILKAEKLADKIYLMEVKAPRVAKSCQPGEFVIVKIDEAGERIPLTICDYNREEGTITIVFQTVGASSEKMSHLQAGDSFHDFSDRPFAEGPHFREPRCRIHFKSGIPDQIFSRRTDGKAGKRQCAKKFHFCLLMVNIVSKFLPAAGIAHVNSGRSQSGNKLIYFRYFFRLLRSRMPIEKPHIAAAVMTCGKVF